MNASRLPDEIKSSLINQVYPAYYGHKKGGLLGRKTKDYNLSDIQREYYHLNNFLQFAKRAYYNQKEKNSKQDQEWAKRMLKTIAKYKLVPILSYGNGDSAWYSLLNGKVYDHNHDYGKFSNSPTKDMYGPTEFKSWARDVMARKRIDAYRRS